MSTEKRTRRSKEEILALVDKAEKLISNGSPKTKAAEEVGISYPVLLKHLGEGVRSRGDVVKILVDKLVATIRAEERKDLLSSLK